MKVIIYTLLLSIFFSCNPPLNKRSILVIGDSLGAGQGWVYHLQKIRGDGPLVNTALSGNTFGFNGMGELRRNTLENYTAYLRKGYAEMGEIDDVLISLGTNDCKAEYAERREEAYENIAKLLTRTRAFFEERGQDVPNIVLITPPAAGSDEVVNEEFQGVAPCVKDLAAFILDLGKREGLCVVDLQRKPGKAILEHSRDGIHFNAEGYAMIAKAIVEACF
jgi:lysophospholipase L1-like esterase